MSPRPELRPVGRVESPLIDAATAPLADRLMDKAMDAMLQRRGLIR